MKNKITELNNLYKPVLDNIEQLRRHLGSRCIEHALVFSNDHHIKIENEIESVQYPIPSIVCKLSGIKTKIGLDLAKSEDYIGFVKFTIYKEQFKLFNFDAIKFFKFEVYGFCFYEELSSYENINKLKTNIINSNEITLYIKIKVYSIEEIISIINNLSTIPQKRFSMTCYTCDCGHQIVVDTYNGQCPICGKDSPHRRKFKTKCPVCETNTFKDKYGHGECENCGWYIDNLRKKHKNSVIYPNLISLNKARKLYKEGRPFTPDFDDFITGYNFYGEMEFTYKGITYGLMGAENVGVEFWGMNTDKYEIYKDIEEFEQKAQINGKLVKDIWHEVENVNWLQ